MVYRCLVNIADEGDTPQLLTTIEGMWGDDSHMGMLGEAAHQVYGYGSTGKLVVTPQPSATECLVESACAAVITSDGCDIIFRTFTVLNTQVVIIIEVPPLVEHIPLRDI